jgi:hypothetical protein
MYIKTVRMANDTQWSIPRLAESVSTTKMACSECQNTANFILSDNQNTTIKKIVRMPQQMYSDRQKTVSAMN